MGTEPVWHMLLVSGGMALAIAGGKIVISILSAYAVVFFRFPFRRTAFWLIFITLMLPVEVRIIPTYAVMSDFGLINSFTGLTVPLIASATATLLFRQVFVAIPDELVEAARMDGAGPLRFLRDILIPVSAANIAALFVILFVYGWNQYLWPLLVATDPGLDTIVIGIVKMIGVETQTDWSAVMATAVLALLPPIVVVVRDAALVRRGTDRGGEVGPRSCSSAGASQLQGQIQFVSDGNAVLAHGRDRGLMCSCCFNSSRPQRLQSEATPLVETQCIQVVVRGRQPERFEPFKRIHNRSKKC